MRDEWEKKVEDAERIKSDCEYEIERYNEMGGFIRPPGGKGVLYRLVHDHSDTASSKLDETIRALNDILTFSFETEESAEDFIYDDAAYDDIPDVEIWRLKMKWTNANNLKGNGAAQRKV